jgi:hypothetical protein
VKVPPTSMPSTATREDRGRNGRLLAVGGLAAALPG